MRRHVCTIPSVNQISKNVYGNFCSNIHCQLLQLMVKMWVILTLSQHNWAHASWTFPMVLCGRWLLAINSASYDRKGKQWTEIRVMVIYESIPPPPDQNTPPPESMDVGDVTILAYKCERKRTAAVGLMEGREKGLHQFCCSVMRWWLFCFENPLFSGVKSCKL